MASSISAGTTSSTALVATADTTGALQLATNNGTVAVTVDTSQNVGIGTASPAGKLDVNGSAYLRSDVFLGSTSTNTTTTVSTTQNWNYTGLNVVRNSSNASTTKGIEFLYGGDSIGNTTIGGTNAIWSFANGTPTTSSTTSGLQSGLIYGAYYGHRWNVNGTEVGRFDNSGNFAVSANGSTNAGIQMNPTGYMGCGNSAGGSGFGFITFYRSGANIGNITQNGTTGVLYNLTSDYRLKDNPTPLTGAKDFVMALQPKTWDWWDGSGKGVGFVAHEFMEVAKYSGHGEKDAVDADNKPIYQSIQPSSSEVMANLVAHIQNLETRLAALEAKVGVSA